MSDSTPRQEYHTSHSMFDRLRSPDAKSKELAWDDFRQRYVPVIAGFARNLGAEKQDIDDIIQDVFLRLFVALPKFEYDPAKGRFRGYLKVVTLNAVRTRVGQRARINTVALTEMNDDDEAVEQTWTTFWDRQILRRALDLVREEYASHPRVFQAFEQYVLLAKPAEEVAAEFDMSVDSVYQAKVRITAAIRERVQHLSGEE